MGDRSEGRSARGIARRGHPPEAKAPTPTDPLSPAGSKIVAAFEEAIEAMRSDDPPGRRLTVRTYRIDFTPRDYGPDDVRGVRGLLGMSQALFARFLGVDANTVRSWEQGNRPPSAIARRFMDEIATDPEYWRGQIVRRAEGVEAGGSSS
jgi:DNA-binding transcriptional regulator YiaG